MSEAVQNIIFSIAVPVIFIAVFWILFWRQAQSTGNQALSFGRSRAKRLTELGAEGHLRRRGRAWTRRSRSFRRSWSS